jgi:hypothetical protein
MKKLLLFFAFIILILNASGQYRLQIEYKGFSPDAQTVIEKQKIKQSYKSVQKMERCLAVLIQK